MSKIKIDDKEYELESLSSEANQQILCIQFVDAELLRLSNQTAVLQTARVAYFKALQQSLLASSTMPTANGIDTIKLS